MQEVGEGGEEWYRAKPKFGAETEGKPRARYCIRGRIGSSNMHL
jgi:hypothetical protein